MHHLKFETVSSHTRSPGVNSEGTQSNIPKKIGMYTHLGYNRAYQVESLRFTINRTSGRLKRSLNTPRAKVEHVAVPI